CSRSCSSAGVPTAMSRCTAATVPQASSGTGEVAHEVSITVDRGGDAGLRSGHARRADDAGAAPAAWPGGGIRGQAVHERLPAGGDTAQHAVPAVVYEVDTRHRSPPAAQRRLSRAVVVLADQGGTAAEPQLVAG